MKGFVEEVPWTAIVLVVAVVAATVLLLIWIFFQLPVGPGKPFSFDIRFANLINRPYLLISSASNVRLDDRTFFEHALQSAVVESLERSNSKSVAVLMKQYLDYYDSDYYSIKVIKKDKTIFEVTNFPKNCGKDGYCNVIFYKTDAGVCNVGWVETDDKCDSAFVCCKEDRNTYTAQPDSFNVVPCGEGDIGICSAMPDSLDFYDEPLICGLGKFLIEDPSKNCEKVNGGKTPMCCAPMSTSIKTYDKYYSAEIPLLYKGEQAVIEVVVA